MFSRPYNYHWCSLTCRQLDYMAASAQPYTAGDVGRAFDRGYQRGYELGLAEGLRLARPPTRAPEALPLEAYRFMIALLHPDKHAGTVLEAAATRAVQWLNHHKPEG